MTRSMGHPIEQHDQAIQNRQTPFVRLATSDQALACSKSKRRLDRAHRDRNTKVAEGRCAAFIVMSKLIPGLFEWSTYCSSEKRQRRCSVIRRLYDRAELERLLHWSAASVRT
jgi:hypothetical protein